MHETIVAQNIFKAIEAEAKKLNAKPLSAKISCGQFNPINDEVLSFAFEIAASGSVCEGMKLNIVHIPLSAACNKCRKTFEFEIYSPICPHCESIEFKLEEDAPLLLEEIELEDPKK